MACGTKTIGNQHYYITIDYQLSLVDLLFPKLVGLYDYMSSSRSERVKDVLRRKIGIIFLGSGLWNTVYQRSEELMIICNEHVDDTEPS